MQICTNCGTENRPGVVFCENCSVALGEVSIATTNIGATGTLEAGSEKLSEDNVIIIHVIGHEDPVMMKIIDNIILGRESDDDIGNLVNLSPFGADNSGVSRRHAMLSHKDEHIVLSDLGSTNHTYLNDQQLSQTDELVVRDGDQVRLGNLYLRVFFK